MSSASSSTSGTSSPLLSSDDDMDGVTSTGARPPRKWSQSEDDCLRAVVERLGARNWKEISKHVPNRSHVQCLQRWNKVLRPGLKKGAWKMEEDEKLLDQVEHFKSTNSNINWIAISKKIPGRTAKQCRERWRCNLDPAINKADWSADEDTLILSLQQELGNRWALLAKSLPGRTENAIKTRYRSLQRSLRRKWHPEEDVLLMSMIQEGKSFEDISKSMNKRTLTAVKERHRVLTEGNGGMHYTPTPLRGSSSRTAAASAIPLPTFPGDVLSASNSPRMSPTAMLSYSAYPQGISSHGMLHFGNGFGHLQHDPASLANLGYFEDFPSAGHIPVPLPMTSSNGKRLHVDADDAISAEHTKRHNLSV